MFLKEYEMLDSGVVENDYAAKVLWCNFGRE